MDHLSKEFKTKSDIVIDKLLVKLETFPGDLPFPVQMIRIAKGFMLDPLDGHDRIKMFIEDSHHTWDAIKSRDEVSLIKALNDEVEEKAPGSAAIVTRLVDFALSNRDSLLGKDLEGYLWHEVGELIKISIEYAHLKRERRKKPDGSYGYTISFASKLKLKSQAETWGIDLM